MAARAGERERQEEANTNRDSEEIISMIGESDGGLDIYIYTAAPSTTDKLHSTLSLEKYFRELISVSKHFLES